MGSVVLAVAYLAAVASWFPQKVLALGSPGPHITDLNILLPPRMTNPVEYRLQGSDGCFRWSWDHHDILSVQPEYNATSRCSTSAQLLSIAPYAGRKETSVYATDLITGTTIRCKVTVDNISRIQIFHHAVKIDLDELSVLQIRGFDGEDNVFSSLVGLQFFWQLLPRSGKADEQNHLIHVPLKETPLSDCGGFCGDLERQIEIEDQGLGSDLHVVKGIEIGQEVVSVKLAEPELEHVIDTIVLTVAEAMSLDPPSPVLITVGSVISYKLRIIRLNAAQVVELPSLHHKWYATNHSVALVDSMLGTVQALDLGFSEIVVEDVRVSGHIQTSAMHVVVPTEIILYLLPVINASAPFEVGEPIPSSVSWYVFPGQVYVVLLKAFPARSKANEIYLTEKNEPRLQSSTLSYWDFSALPNIYLVATNWHHSRLLTPKSEGKCSLTASITYQRDILAPSEVIQLVHEVNVCDKVQLFFEEQIIYSKIIRLPWIPGAFQEVKLKPVGGCGRTLNDFKWFSSDEAIISISSSGVAYARRPGQVTVKAVSAYNVLNYDEVVIDVSIPKSMSFIPIHPVEAVVGSELQAAVTFRTSNGEHFVRCDAFSSLIRWRIKSESESFKIIEKPARFLNVDDNYGSPCAWVHLHASSAGGATIAATLTYDIRSYSDLSDGPTVLKAAKLVSSHYPLVVYQAGSGNQFGGYHVNLSVTEAGDWITERKGLDELYLVPGSTMDVQLFGGPQRWSPRVEFIDTLHVLEQPDSSTTDAVMVNRLSHQMYRISCETRGKIELHFSRGNLAGDDHPLAAIANAYLLVVCDVPSSITLIANEPDNAINVIRAASRADRNPERIQANPVVVSNGQAIRLAAVGIQASEIVFANASSLYLKWELIGCDGLAYLDATKDVNIEISTWEQFLVLQNSTGRCIVRASVVGFSELTVRNLQAKVHSLLLGIGKDDLSDALELQIVSSLRVIPESIMLVYHPDVKISLSISGGTCFLEAASNDTQVVQIIQHPQGVHCTNLVVGVTGLGTAVVAVHDIGLSPSVVASATLKVANVDWIKIIASEQISLMEGTERDFEILAGTEDGETFDFSQYMYMDIDVHTDGEVLQLITATVAAHKFSIKALNLGMTSLYVSAKQMSGKRVLSEHIEVEVYRRLRLHPEYIYLVPGASYVFSVDGGPKLDAAVEYSSMNEQAIRLNSTSGRLLANSVGNATIRAIAYTRSGSFICDAFGTVEVGIPSALSLNSQSERLCVGCTMPVFPSFPKGDLFSFYGVCQAYRWKIENEEVLRFELSEEQDFHDKDHAYRNLLIGRSAGKSAVSVSISCDFVNSGRVQQVLYNSSKLVTVVPDPPLALGLPFTWLLPPFYSTSQLLPSQAGVTYTMLRPCGRNDNAVVKQEIEESISVGGSCVMTGGIGDIGCIQVKDQVTGRDEIAACIRVGKVSQVRITASKSSVRAASLAVGDMFELHTLYCDELGYLFSEANGVVPVDIETNYPDVLSIFVVKDANSTVKERARVVLQARRPGTALIKISIDKNPKKSDFIVVSVGAQIYPRDPNLSVGQYVNFTIIGDGNGMEKRAWSGKWSSGNESILSIHKMTGEAHARGAGTVKVMFGSSDLKLETKITVNNVGQLTLGSTAETLTNVQFPADGYKFLVKFSDPKDHKTGGTSKLVGIPFDCKVEPAFIGYSKPWTDRFTETSYCLFFPHPPDHLLSFMLNSKVNPESKATKKRFIDVSIIASVRDDPNVRAVVTAPVFGGFSIPEARQVYLSPSSNESLILTVGNTDFELTWKFKDLMSVRPVKVFDFGITGKAEYQVQLLKREPFSDKIVFYLPATGQREEVRVMYETDKATSTLTEATISRKLGIFFSCAALIITVFLSWKCYDRPKSTPPPAHQAGRTSNPPDFPPATPVRQIGTTVLPSSPQSEPFLDYVRRTVDETPYKRSGRLRYDVQKSY